MIVSIQVDSCQNLSLFHFDSRNRFNTTPCPSHSSMANREGKIKKWEVRAGAPGGWQRQAALGQIGVQQLGSCLLSPYGTRALLATVRHMKIPYFDSWRGKRIRRCLQSKTDNGSYSPTHTPTTYSHMLSHRVPQFNLGKFQLIHSLTHAQAYFYLCGESLRWGDATWEMIHNNKA